VLSSFQASSRQLLAFPLRERTHRMSLTLPVPTLPLPTPAVPSVPEMSIPVSPVQEREAVTEVVAPPLGMKLTCKQAELAAGLACVSRAVLPHSTQPILQNILLSTDQGRLRLQGTDLAIGIQLWIDAEIASEGMTALPADLFTKMISLMPSGSLTLSIAPGSQTLEIEASGSATSLLGQDPREFPTIPMIEPESAQQFSVIEARLLKRMIEDVAFAAATDESRPVLTAVFFHVREGALILAACNPHRMTEFISPLEIASGAKPVLIPAKNLQELARILPAQGKIRMLITPQRNLLIFQRDEGDNLNFVTRLIEGEYPPYKQALPKTFPTNAVIETKNLLAALARAALFAHDEFKTVRLFFKPDGLLVEAEDSDMGHHVSSIPAQVTGSECQILCPVKFMREALDHLDGPQTQLGVSSTGKPAVFRPISDMQYISMVMSAREKAPAPDEKEEMEKPQKTERKSKKKEVVAA
jgi:DNA polymerase-3 subunit beta